VERHGKASCAVVVVVVAYAGPSHFGGRANHQDAAGLMITLFVSLWAKNANKNAAEQSLPGRRPVVVVAC
jgi:hypothetical protein